MQMNVRQWIVITLCNLLIVALLGTLMRYKITWELPVFSQRNLQHAHSHFAFTGWVTQVLMVAMVAWMHVRGTIKSWSRYNILLWANLLCAYTMLIAFAAQGYAAVSIVFSTLSIVIFYTFAVVFFRDNKDGIKDDPSAKWFLAALFFGILSTAGTLALSYIMSGGATTQHWYLASVYYFLHFQYNGWFFFACGGLLVAMLIRAGCLLRYEPVVFTGFAVACIPAYFLSILWAALPWWLYGLVILAAAIQVIAWGLLITDIRNNMERISKNLSKASRFLLLYAGVALTIKLLLQLGSVIPEVSRLAFGFRPIVMAYLHLILLATVSVFLLAYMTTTGWFRLKPSAHAGLIVFCTGVFANELILATQGIAGLRYIVIPYAHEMLFYTAALIAVGCMLMIWSQVQGRTASDPAVLRADQHVAVKSHFIEQS